VKRGLKKSLTRESLRLLDTMKSHISSTCLFLDLVMFKLIIQHFNTADKPENMEKHVMGPSIEKSKNIFKGEFQYLLI